MKREKLEQYLYKKVKIKLFDDTIVQGTLMQGNGYFWTPKLYHCLEAPGVIDQCVFRSSHVKKVEITS